MKYSEYFGALKQNIALNAALNLIFFKRLPTYFILE